MMPDWRVEARRRLIQKLRPRPAFEPEEFPRGDSAVARYDLRVACIEWCAFDYDFEFHVTIQNNEPTTEHQQMDIARRFGALVNSFCLGKRWQRWPAGERAFYTGVAEVGAVDNHHLHLLLRMPPQYTRAFALQTKHAPWKRAEQERWLSRWFTKLGRAKYICPHGDIKFRRLCDERDRLVAADYVFKKYGPGSNLILSTQFDPAAKGNHVVTAKRPTSDSRLSAR
jgi:hypothetical protein